MPWTIDDVDKHKSGLTQAQKRRWVSIANDVRKKCLDDDNSESYCDGLAIRQANGVVGNMQHIINKLASAIIRRTIFNNRTHVVAPVVLMVEGIHHGSAGRILYTAEELSRMPVTWNGRPVPIMHPTDPDGSPTTCNDPDVLESQTVGRVFNVEWEPNNQRLKGELWIDEERARQVCSNLNLPDVIGMMDGGDSVEVSTGLFPEESDEGGVWNGQEYDASAINIHSDHLAILPGYDQQGACSWQDGCGIRNQENGGEDGMKRTKKSDQECQINSELTINKLSYSGTESTDWSAPNLEDFGIETNRWSDLSQSERARVAGHFLIGTSRADDFGELKFPVVNPSNGNLNERALRAVISGRGAQIEGISADKRAAARRRAYNLLNEEFDAELEIPENLEAAGEKCHTLQVNVSDGYMELMQKLRDKIDSLDNELRVNFLEDFDNEKLVYRVANREAGGDSYYRRSYTVSDDGTVGLGDDIEQVNKKVDVTWNPVQSQAYNTNQNSGGVSMNKKTDEQKQNEQGCCPEKVEAVINAEVNDFTEDDRETLQAMSEEVIDKIPVKEPEPATNQNQQEQQMDFDTLLQNADSELRQSIERGRELYRQERQGMVQRILDNSSQFTQEELDQMDHAMLQKVANSIKPAVNYKGAGGAPVNSQEELEEGIGMPWLQQVETAKQQ